MKVEVRYSDPPESIPEGQRIDISSISVYRNACGRICMRIWFKTLKYIEEMRLNGGTVDVMNDEIIEFRCPESGNKLNFSGLSLDSFSGDNPVHSAGIYLVPENKEESYEFEDIFEIAFIPLKYEYIVTFLKRDDFWSENNSCILHTEV